MPPIYLLRLSEDRQEIFEGSARDRDWFAEPVADFRNSGQYLVLIISASGQLTHVASGTQGHIRAGTGLKRLNLTHIEELPSPFSLTDLMPHIGTRFHYHVERYFKNGGLPPGGSALALITALIKSNPDIEGLLQRYRKDRYAHVERFPERVRENLATQKDALSTALSIAGIEKDELEEWSIALDERPKSFLDGLPSAYLREDQMILRDLHKIPGLEKMNELVSGAAHFEGPNSSLTVVLANRLPLEELTGTDLIYFNEIFNSFVMVQYKAMENENGESVFRLPNTQLAKEISRMEKIRATFSTLLASNDPNDFRISENPFFLKLCPRIDLRPGSAEMTTGMYLPLDYWHILDADPSMTGPKGGRQVTYKNVRRHLNNTEFINTVRKAWIGTNAAQSRMLEPLIRSVVESGKAALIAIRSGGVLPEMSEEEM